MPGLTTETTITMKMKKSKKSSSDSKVKSKKKSKTSTSDDSKKSKKKSVPKAAKSSVSVSAESDNEDSVMKKKKRTASLMSESNMEEKKSKKSKGSAELPENALEKFRISSINIQVLKKDGINSLFDIQSQTFDSVYDGCDVIARAFTGSGKTLAFALPICERICAQNSQAMTTGKNSLPHGRAPRVLVVAPTRELARQVASVFEKVGRNLSVALIYGGAPYGPQEASIRRGIDVLVGTPGRINDFLTKKASLDLSKLECIILDEADEMLNIGFAKDIEQMLETVPGPEQRQMLLFSATIPTWIKEVSRKYLKSNKITIDLVGEKKRQASSDVEHIMMPVFWSERPGVIGDCIRLYSKGGRSIVFAATKKECNELAVDAALNVDAQVLHGDIAQAQREITLRGFREGKFTCLIATDVAARGLDISGVDLVIQSEPPSDVETYIHRSGRTGRAGKSGISIALYAPKHLYFIQQIERKGGVQFKIKGCPQPLELMSLHAKAAEEVTDEQCTFMMGSARELIASRGAEAAVAAALFMASGMKQTMKMSRSLLTGQNSYVTINVLSNVPVHTLSFVWNMLRGVFDNSVVDDVKGIRLRKDGMGAVCDVPVRVRQMVENMSEHRGITLLKHLPDIVEKQCNTRPPSFGNRRQSSGSAGRGGARSFGRGRGGFSGFRGGNGSYSNGRRGGNGAFNRSY